MPAKDQDRSPPGEPRPATGRLGQLLDEVADLTTTDDHPSLDSVMAAFGPAGALPLMILVALVIVSPLSGIPFLSSLGGLTIAVIAVQLAVGRRGLWLPGWLSRRSIPRDRLLGALDRLRPVALFLDWHSRPRLRVVAAPPMAQLVLLLCALAGLSMPLLEILPFTSSLLALCVTLLGLSMLTRDGLWAALAVMPLGGAGWLLAALVI